MALPKTMLPGSMGVYALIVLATFIFSCSKVSDLQHLSQDSEEARRRWSRRNQDTTQVNGDSTQIGTDTTQNGGQTGDQHSFSFAEIPFSEIDLVNPGRGAEQWHDRTDVNVPQEGVNTPAMDVYYRFVWTRLEGRTQGSYDWSYFDNLVNAAIQKRQKFSFGIMTVYPEGTTNEGLQSYGGGTGAYPEYLHNLMQGESVKDWRSGATWVPNYNSANYLNRLLALNQALNQHIQTASYNGVPYRNVIQNIDIRGYGSWGEWHSAGLVDNTSQYPAGTFPTVESFRKIVDAHTQGFPDIQLVAMIAAFDANWLNNTNNPPEIAYYVLTTRNNHGPIGWRRDQWGATDNYLHDYLENNTRSYNGVVFKDLIMDRWKTAPITGEPPAWNPNDYADLERQIRLYHASSFGNGNYGPTMNATIKDRVRASSKASGYRIKILSGQAPDTIARNSSFALKSVWQNVGLAPTYENWDVMFELQNSSNNAVYSMKSSKVLRLFLPSTAGVATTDNFTIPSSVPAGTYKLVVRVKDPSNYRSDLKLAVSGRNADGTYTIYSKITIL